LGSLEQGDEEVQVQLLGVQIILGKLEESRWGGPGPVTEVEKILGKLQLELDVFWVCFPKSVWSSI
jgi:hypothetical protein